MRQLVAEAADHVVRHLGLPHGRHGVDLPGGPHQEGEGSRCQDHQAQYGDGDDLQD